MKRQLTPSASLVWLVVVAAAWVLTTPLLAALINTTGSTTSDTDLIGQSMASATFACVVVGGPATAVALRARRRHGQGRAALSGLVTAVLVLLFSWSYVAATGTPFPWAWQPLLPLVIVIGGQLWLALRLYRLSRQAASPAHAPLAQEGSDELPPD